MNTNDKRNGAMKKLRIEEGFTFLEIGNKYGISRQRVQQIIGSSLTLISKKVRHDKRKAFALNHPELTNCELSEEMGLSISRVCNYRLGTRHAISGGNAKLAADGEDYVSRILNKKGIGHKLMPYHHKFGILLNSGKTAAVKSAYVESKAPSLSSPMYRFGMKNRMQADFFICIIMGTKDIFIIPSHEAPLRASLIAFTWPPKMNRSKYKKYHNRFDLLRINYEGVKEEHK